MRKLILLLGFFPALVWGSYNPSTGGGGGGLLASTQTWTGLNTFTNVTASTFTVGTASIYDGNHSIYAGESAGNQTGQFQVGLGDNACLNTGAGNIGIGFFSMSNTGSSSNDIGIGQQTLGQLSVSGGENVAIGDHAMSNAKNTTTNNVAIGQNALKVTNNYGESVAVGAFALEKSSSGFENTAVGYHALNALDTGFDNVAVGNFALSASTNSVADTALGYGAGGYPLNPQTELFNSGGGNTFIGEHTGIVSSNTVISNSMALGESALIGCSNCGVLGPDVFDARTMNIGVGISTPTAKLHIVSPTSNAYEFLSSTAVTSFFHVGISTSGHSLTNGSPPTISSCGTTPNGSVVGDDNEGTITVGGGAVTACTLTFLKTWGVAPICVITDNSTASIGDISAISATAFTTSFSVSIGGGTIWYRCGCSGASCL
jgi:hypothetical protein